MSKNLSYLVLGFVVCILAVFGLGWILTRADAVTSVDTALVGNDVLSREDFNKSASDTNTLSKNGDLPITITADELGRENPFDSY